MHIVSSGSDAAAMLHRWRAKTAWLVFLLLVTAVHSNLNTAAMGQDRIRDGQVILGRITWRQYSVAENGCLGPVRMPVDARDLFRRVLPRGRAARDQSVREAVDELLANSHLILRGLDKSSGPTMAQWDPDPVFDLPGGSLLGGVVWDPSSLPQPGTHECDLVLRSGRPQNALEILHVESQHVEVRNHQRPMLRYNYGIVRERGSDAGANPGPYDRACYLHPIWTPAGNVVTGDFSPEHIHQRGLFTAWVKSRFDEIEADFWGLGASPARTLSAGAAPRTQVGPVFARVAFENRGVVEGETVYAEQVVLTIYAESTAGGWMFDIETTQTPTAGRAMELPQVYYGGTSYRGPAEWLSEDSRDVQRAKQRGVSFENANWLPSDVKLDVLTDSGLNRTSGDRQLARWVDYTGPLGARNPGRIATSWGGLVMVNHFSNPRHPSPVRIHPELPYFSWAIVQQEPLTIPAGDSLRLRYRIWVHDSRPDAELNERIAQGYRLPPTLSWRPNTER